MREDAAMAVDLIFGIALLAVGTLLFVQRNSRVALARERGHGIKSPLVHTAVALAMIVFGIWSIATALAG
jgi:hypothetical protein